MIDAPVAVFRCCDVETSGLLRDGAPAEEQPFPVEIGYTDVFWRPGAPARISEPCAELVNAGREIPPEASGIHHIRTGDIAGARAPADVIAALHAGDQPGEPPTLILVAHPTDFDLHFIGGTEPRICTHKSSLRVWTEAPDHKVQTLRYWLKLDDDPAFDRELAWPPHRAAPDSYVLAHLLRRLLIDGTTIEDMLRWSSGPALLVTCFLPKHRGKRWSEVAETDRGYLHWIVDKSDLDRDHKATARYWLKKNERT